MLVDYKQKMIYSLLFLLNVSVALGAIDYTPLFDKWVERFNMKFENEYHRGNVFSNWVSNHVYISKMNSLNRTYTLGHNQFSGMSSEEFSAYLKYSSFGVMSSYGSPVSGRFSKERGLRGAFVNVESLPDSVDWVEKGAVTPVKDQGQCGSCWSFSTTGALEGAYAIKYGKLVSFSEQQLVDCDNLRNGGKDHGCNGGLMDNAFSWIKKNGGLCSEDEYPYVSGETKTSGECVKSCKLESCSELEGYVDVESSNEMEMMKAVSNQPVSIAIEADQKDFQLYKSGVFVGLCGTKLDHGVLLVGYGEENGLSYYKVKNSWSSSWGESGYIRLGRGSQYNNGAGQCGLLLQGSYPLVAGDCVPLLQPRW